MNYFFQEYALFLAKIVTLTIPVILVIHTLVSGKRKGGRPTPLATASSLRVGDYTELMLANARVLIGALSARGLQHRELKLTGTQRRTAFILMIADESLAGRLSALKLEVSAVLMAAHADDIVLVRIKNRGGAVDAFGSAASQLGRLRVAGLRIVVSIDEVATSGGYLIATMADEIIATPFACVGSIGLISSQLNFGSLLERFGVKNEVVTAGEHKLTMNAYNPNTPALLQTQQDYLRGGLETWEALIGKQRPAAKLKEVTTGKIWFGTDALRLGLIDRLQSFDDYVTEHFERYHFLTVGTEGQRAVFSWRNRVVQLMQRFI